MTLATLFGKLQEHEMELMRQHHHEENDKKKKGIALKATSSNQENLDHNEIEVSDLEDDENLCLFVKRFNKFLRNKGTRRKQPFITKMKERRYLLYSKML